MYWDVNNLYGWIMLQNLPVDGFERRKDKLTFDKELIQDYDENSDKEYIPEFGFKYTRELHKLHRDLAFLPSSMKTEKCEKSVCNLCNKKNCVTQIKAPKETLDHDLYSKKSIW